MPLAGGVRVPALRGPRRVSDRRPTAVAVRPVPVSGVGDGRNRDAQDPAVVAVVVLGGVLDGYRHSGDVGEAVATPTCAEPIRHGVDDAAQAAPRNGSP